MKPSQWQQYRTAEQQLKKIARLTGDLEDLCHCSEKRFKELMTNELKLAPGDFYEFLFFCILHTVLGEEFAKADIRTVMDEHYNATICGVRCDLTMEQSVRKKQAYPGITLIRFPHKNYFSGRRVNKRITTIVLDAVREYDLPIVPDEDRLACLNNRIARYAY